MIIFDEDMASNLLARMILSSVLSGTYGLYDGVVAESVKRKAWEMAEGFSAILESNGTDLEKTQNKVYLSGLFRAERVARLSGKVSSDEDLIKFALKAANVAPTGKFDRERSWRELGTLKGEETNVGSLSIWVEKAKKMLVSLEHEELTSIGERGKTPLGKRL